MMHAHERRAGRKKWIQKMGMKEGALRETAKHMGLVHGDEPMSKSDMKMMEQKGSAKTKRRVRLARTLKKMGKKS